MIETIRYPVPQPVPALAVRRLVPDDAAQVAALYRASGRDGAWCGADTVRALFEMDAVWWGGFADGDLVLCAACAASTADTPQAAALRGALAQGTGGLHCLPEYFLLPPAVSRQGEALAGALLPLLAQQLFPFGTNANRSNQTKKTEWFVQYIQEGPAHLVHANLPCGTETESDAACPRGTKAAPVLLAALPVKAPAPVLAAYFAAGFAALRMRPLVSLRPHYLLVRHSAAGQETQYRIPQVGTAKAAAQSNTQNSVPAQKTKNSTRQADAENGTPEPKIENTAPPPQPEPDALRRVYLPLADTLAVSRLLEQGFCATALCRSRADERTLIRLEQGLERGNS